MVTTEELQKLISRDTTLFWHRRDLRIADNAGLYYALKRMNDVLPVFIFDTVILDKLDRTDRRVEFIHQSIATLKKGYEKVGSTLLVLRGNPIEIFSQIRPKAVYCNHDYELYAIQRDREVEKILKANGSEFHSYKDQVIFEKSEVEKDNCTPYTVFTPYSKKWKSLLNDFYLAGYPTEKYARHLKKLKSSFFPSLGDLGFTKTHSIFPDGKVKTKIIENYQTTRDYPGRAGTSRLSAHLRFGTVSIRQLARIANQRNETWLNELIWRDFYQMILWHFPRVVTQSFKPRYDYVEWRNDEKEFAQWCEGKTGYPIVDAGMRELNETGYMHNRVRMIVASFLTKHLLIDWRWGEAYFAKKLLDFDLAANNGGWQWAAGCGCDAAPYFRVFNPELQTKKFDPNFTYIKKWVPEFNTPNYPKPIVDHQTARERVLRVYRQALQPALL